MKVRDFLEKENIFEYALLPYSSLRVTDEKREERLKNSLCVKSAVIFLMPYYIKCEKSNISRYAMARDYHFFIKELCERAKKDICVPLEICSDTSPIDEVGGAVSAGLGCVGENGLIINKRYGSYVFIGEIFFDREVDDVIFQGIEKRDIYEKCLGCGACARACETGGIYDRKNCVSFINQKKRLDEGDEEIIKKSGLVWGCDLCQECCPMNKGEETPIEYFKEKRIERLTPDTFNELIISGEFDKRSFAWRGEAVVERNLAIFEEDK